MSARSRRKRARKRQKRENEHKQINGNENRPTIMVRCRFYEKVACDWNDGTPCLHGTPHEVYSFEDLGPNDYCSGECQCRGIQTWCTRVR